MATTDAADNGVPAACTLPTAEQPLRLAEFDDFFQAAVRRSIRAKRTRLDLVISPQNEASARDLAEREASCCAFFRFDFDRAGDDVVMRVGVPDGQVDVLDDLQARVSTILGRALNNPV